MTRKMSSIIVACLLALSIVAEQNVWAAEKDTRLSKKVRAAVLELGTGQTTRVYIKLRDKTRLTGYITEIGESSFVVTDLTSAEATTVSYPDVVQVKGNNLSTGAKIAIAAAIIAGVAIVLYIVKGAFCDGC